MRIHRRSRFLDEGHQRGLNGGLELVWLWFLVCEWFWGLGHCQEINTSALKVGEQSGKICLDGTQTSAGGRQQEKGGKELI